MTGADLYPEFMDAYPEFSAESSGIPQRVAERGLETARRFVCAAAFGQWRDQAVFLLAAHRLALRYPLGGALEANGLNPDAASSASAASIGAGTGSLSQTVAHNAKTRSEHAFEADLGRTGYGLEYLALLETVAPLARVVVSRDEARQ